jgi:hypothetical protein
MDTHKIYAMRFAVVYPLYITKAERKGRSRAEVDQIIYWLTGYDAAQLAQVLDAGTDFAGFFANAPALNPNRALVTGVVCGIRVEDITAPLMREIRILDKMIDELAKGRALAKVLRQPKGVDQ